MGERANEIELRDGIIKDNFVELDALMRRLSSKYGRCKADRDDLYQLGWVVCLECVKMYNPKKNDSFVGYVSKAIEIQIAKAGYELPKMESINGYDLRRDGHEDTRSIILEEIDNLDATSRDLIYSHYYHDIPLRTWAEKNKTTTSEARAILSRAHRDLRDALT